jgi:type IV secretion system protein VirD4
MSVRPAVRREGPLDQFLLLGVAVLLGATFMLWLTGQVAGFIHSGSWPKVSLPEMGVVVTRVPRHPLDPAAAWPPGARRLLPGPVLFWATFLILLAIVTAAWMLLSAALRSFRKRMGRVVVVERETVTTDQVDPAGWARPQAYRELYVRAPTTWRVTLGRVNGRLAAAEPLQSVIALGPTQSQKTSGLAIPSMLEWDGPVLAACVKPDLIRSTIDRRWQRGEVFVYDPAGATGMQVNTWSPLSRCETWEGAHRMALSLVDASRLARRVDREEAIPGAATNLLASMLLAAAISRRTMGDVLRWAQHQDKTEVTPGIDVAAEPAAADAFGAIWNLPEQSRSQIYAQVQGVLAAYTDPTVKEPTVATRFTAEQLLDGVANTAYVTLPAHEQRRLGPLTVALVQDVVELAFQRSRNRGGAPIDPALLVVLDDAASSAALPQLDMYAAIAGNHGVQLVTSFRHLGQIRARYGDRAEAVFDNHRAKVILSGVTDPDTLALLSLMLEDEAIRHLATPAALAKAGGARDRGAGDGEPPRGQQNRSASPAEALRWISPGHGVLLYGHLPPAYITLRPWFRDRQLQDMVNPADLGGGGRRRALRSLRAPR